jgi:hypothetical protein
VDIRWNQFAVPPGGTACDCCDKDIGPDDDGVWTLAHWDRRFKRVQRLFEEEFGVPGNLFGICDTCRLRYGGTASEYAEDGLYAYQADSLPGGHGRLLSREQCLRLLDSLAVGNE